MLNFTGSMKVYVAVDPADLQELHWPVGIDGQRSEGGSVNRSTVCTHEPSP